MCERDKAEKVEQRERPENLAEFLLNSPLVGIDIEFRRDKSHTRQESLSDEDE